MEIKIRTAIASHLSDAQHLTDCGLKKQANDHINFAKVLLFMFDDLNQYLNEAEFDRIWNEKIRN